MAAELTDEFILKCLQHDSHPSITWVIPKEELHSSSTKSTSIFHRWRAGKKKSAEKSLRFPFVDPSKNILFSISSSGPAQMWTARICRTHCETFTSMCRSTKISRTMRWCKRLMMVWRFFFINSRMTQSSIYSVTHGSHRLRLPLDLHSIARRKRLFVQQGHALQAGYHHIILYSWSLSNIGGKTKGEHSHSYQWAFNCIPVRRQSWNNA